ncbi:MAG: alkaline phosphatase family protein [Acidobacteriota bacterium]
MNTVGRVWAKLLRCHRISLSVATSLLILISVSGGSPAALGETRRMVVIKADGVPQSLIDRFIKETNPHTGRSVLPWIQHVFYQGGTRLSNFYVRGLTLSAPSWSILDTGRHSVIKGNAEYDRFNLRCDDYLNFFSFYLRYSVGRRVDMPGVEVLDEMGIPLLVDAFQPTARFQGFQLFQRGARISTLRRSLKRLLVGRGPKGLVDEWTMGLDGGKAVFEQLEKELMTRLQDPHVRYLDYFTASYDHLAHVNPDRQSQVEALREIDGLVGRIWTAIQQSPLAQETVLLLLSDHGMNSQDGIYSQGFNLVNYLGRPEGGGHHVLMNRPPLSDFSFKSLLPTVPLVTTEAQHSFYLRGQKDHYPTAVLDLDGNERGSVYLRNSDLNLLHILWLQLRAPSADPARRKAVLEAFLQVLRRNQPSWTRNAVMLAEEVKALENWIEVERRAVQTLSRKAGGQEKHQGKEKSRRSVRLASREQDVADYRSNLVILQRLLDALRTPPDPTKSDVQELIPRRSLGVRNSLHQLQNYVVGPAEGGMVLDHEGRLDLENSFRRVNYLTALTALRVRNNPQPALSSHPVDFVAVSLPSDAIQAVVEDPLEGAVLLFRDEEAQALLLSRLSRDGQLQLRYWPVQKLKQTEEGQIDLQPGKWKSGLPLEIWEDPRLQIPRGEEHAWLEGWHTDQQWLEALFGTKYSNALISLHEYFTYRSPEGLNWEEEGEDAALVRRFYWRKRQASQPDLIVFANNHWNFNVRGFNPGGNHGSFFQLSTHATLMLAGGARTGIPRGLVVDTPYDSLSVVPTLVRLMGMSSEKRFRGLPGPPIAEVIAGHP